MFPFPRTNLLHGLCDRDAECGEAVRHGDTDLKLGDLSVEVPRHEALCPSSFTRRIFVSTRLQRWYPLQRRHWARPRYFDARSASSRARAPAATVFHGLAFWRGGMTARALRSAMASWHLRVSQAPSAVTLPICSRAGICLEQVG